MAFSYWFRLNKLLTCRATCNFSGELAVQRKPLSTGRKMNGMEVQVLSKSIVKPSSSTTQREKTLQLTPWELKILLLGYIQKAIFLPLPAGEDTITVISRLRSSLSLTLDHFYPLAGRLSVTKHDTTPPTISFSVDCNDEGVDFVHAVASPAAAASDILTPLVVPQEVERFFLMKEALNIDALSIPIVGIQVTELVDCLVLSCSFNHAVGDGTSFWDFMNAWSEISRTGNKNISRPPVIQRRFPESLSLPIHLPFMDPLDLMKSGSRTGAFDVINFTVSANSVAELKAKANEDMNGDVNVQVSSLQALLAHVWRCLTRARQLNPGEVTLFFMAVGHRSRLRPPLPSTYFGNPIDIVMAGMATADDLLTHSLGWAAVQLNRAVAAETDEKIRSFVKSWTENPIFIDSSQWKSTYVLMGSSTRFDVYGNDFGWGKPVGLRSGPANWCDGKINVYEGPEKGSVQLELCLSPETINGVLDDPEFMQAVTAP